MEKEKSFEESFNVEGFAIPLNKPLTKPPVKTARKLRAPAKSASKKPVKSTRVVKPTKRVVKPKKSEKKEEVEEKILENIIKEEEKKVEEIVIPKELLEQKTTKELKLPSKRVREFSEETLTEREKEIKKRIEKAKEADIPIQLRLLSKRGKGVVTVQPTSFRDFNIRESVKASLEKQVEYADGGKVEIEMSFGNIDSNGVFHPGILSQTSFDLLKSRLSTANPPEKTKTTVDISDNIRRITNEDGDVFFEKKIRERDPIIIEKYGVRVYHSVETPLNEFDTTNFKPSLQRKRERYSFKDWPEDSLFFGFRIDMTIVTEQYNDRTLLRRELEIEILDKREVEDVITVLTTINKGLYCLEEGSDSQNIDKEEMRHVVTLHNSLIGEKSEKRRRNLYKMFTGYWNKPRNIKKDDFFIKSVKDSLTTVKLNGSRKFLLVTEYGIYLLGPPYDIFRVGNGLPLYSGTLLDGELIALRKKDEDERVLRYFVFDVLFQRFADIRSRSFDERYKTIDSIVGSIGSSLEIPIQVKKFYKDGILYKRMEDALNEYKDLEENYVSDEGSSVDGIIIQSSKSYNNRTTFKWKETKDLTLDVLLRPAGEEEGIYKLYVGADKIKRSDEPTLPFVGSFKYPFDGDLTSTRNLDYQIVEVAYRDQNFVPLRVRTDRDKPNEESVAIDVWNDINDPISEATITGKNLQLFSQFLHREEEKLYPILGDSIILLTGNTFDSTNFETPFDNFVESFSRIQVVKELPLKRIDISKYSQVIESYESFDDLDYNLNVFAFFGLGQFFESNEGLTKLSRILQRMREGTKFVCMILDGQSIQKNLKSKETITTDSFTIKPGEQYTGEIGDNVIITVNDPENGVYEETLYETLVNAEILAARAKKESFSLLINKIVTENKSSILNEEVKLLPDSAKIFATLVRVMVFEKKPLGESAAIQSLIPSLNEKIDLHNPFSYRLSYIGVDIGVNNILHAYLRATSKEYRDLLEKFTAKSSQDRSILQRLEELTTKLRTTLSDSDASFLNKNLLENLTSGKQLNANLVLPLLSKVKKVNIYILSHTPNVFGQRNKSGLYINPIGECETFYSTNQNSIILYTIDDLFYFPVGVDDQKLTTYFSPKSKLAITLYKQTCSLPQK